MRTPAPVDELVADARTADMDPEVRAHLERRAAGSRPLWEKTPEEARCARAARTSVDDEAAQPSRAAGAPSALVEVGTRDEAIDGGDGRELPIRIYDGQRDSDIVIVFFHGGGFVTGDLDTHHDQAVMLAERTGCTLVSVAYRLAPEHPIPAAQHDAFTAIDWVQSDQGTCALGIHEPRVAVAGMSAGANLAANASREFARRGRPIIAQLLAYPWLDAAEGSGSRRLFTEGPGLSTRMVDWYRGHALAGADPHDVEAFSPLRDPRFDLLPPTVLGVAMLDSLRDDGLVYAARLKDAGVPVSVHLYDRLPHGFWGMVRRSSGAASAAHELVARFCDLLQDGAKDEGCIMQQSVNPASGELIAEYETHNAAEVDAALDAAVRAQREWRRTPIETRLTLLTAIARELRADAESLSQAITREMGKPIVESRAEIEKSAVTLDHYAAHSAGYLQPDIIESNAMESSIVFEPLGVVLAVMPWNYPFWQFFRFVAPALAVGNGAVLKHASNVPECAQLIAEIMRRAGTPEGLFAALLIGSGEVAGLIADDRIAAVTLTGSSQVGSRVASRAGAALKKHVLELGGSDPFIVLADADLEAAAKTAVAARFNAVGQSCVNAKRFIVESSVADRFVEFFVAAARELVVGDPTAASTRIGPLARRDLRDALHEQVQRTVASGADLLLGGGVIDGPGNFYAPTILDHVAPGMAAFDEETFGPVAAVVRAGSAEEAIELANRSEYGLGAALWTSDIQRARELVPQIDAGAVFVNGMVASDARLPFGGIKKSGYGRELGGYGLREFTNTKTVWIGPATNLGGDTTMAYDGTAGLTPVSSEGE